MILADFGTPCPCSTKYQAYPDPCREKEKSMAILVMLQALDVNLNPLWYGVMAEIGAGQVCQAPCFLWSLPLMTLEC